MKKLLISLFALIIIGNIHASEEWFSRKYMRDFLENSDIDSKIPENISYESLSNIFIKQRSINLKISEQAILKMQKQLKKKLLKKRRR